MCLTKIVARSSQPSLQSPKCYGPRSGNNSFLRRGISAGYGIRPPPGPAQFRMVLVYYLQPCLRLLSWHGLSALHNMRHFQLPYENGLVTNRYPADFVRFLKKCSVILSNVFWLCYSNGQQFSRTCYHAVNFVNGNFPMGNAAVRRNGEPDDQCRESPGVHSSTERTYFKECKFPTTGSFLKEYLYYIFLELYF